MRLNIIILLTFITSCIDKHEKKENIIIDNTETISLEEEAIQIFEEENNLVIDSLKMHAFDNLYFGSKNLKDKDHKINEINYTVSDYSTCHYTLQSKYPIKTKKKLSKEIQELKELIKKKHDKYDEINKIITFKHSEEAPKDASPFLIAASEIYNDELVGFEYKNIKYAWNLNYKTIKIGHKLKYEQIKNSYLKDKNNYSYYIFIEFKSKLINDDNVEKNKIENNESEKF